MSALIFPGHSFPVRNDISYAKQEFGRHILNGLNFNKKQWQTSKQPILPSFVKRTEKKLPMIAWETSLFNGCTHTHTHTRALDTERDLQSRFGREKTHQKV